MNNWRENEKYPVAEWRTEVANDETRLGYGDWTAARVAAEPPGEKPPHGSTEDRERSCQQRIVAQQDGREAQYQAWFADLDSMSDNDVVTLAVNEVDGFELTAVETQVVALATDGNIAEDTVVSNGGVLAALVEQQRGIMADRAREAITEMRDEGNVSETVLAVDMITTMRVQLSTGGPADYLTCDVDTESRSIGDVTYHFADWFDHAERSVDPDSPLARLCEYFAEVIGDN